MEVCSFLVWIKDYLECFFLLLCFILFKKVWIVLFMLIEVVVEGVFDFGLGVVDVVFVIDFCGWVK